MYQLFYYPCNASLAPHFVLAHLRAEYELVLVDRKSEAQKSPEYLALNPAGRIPTLTENGHAIFESPAICWHLAEQHPEHCLIPALHSPLRPKALQWLMYLTNTLQAELMIYYYPEKHTDDNEGSAAIVAIVASQQRRISEMFELLDNEIGSNDFLVGDRVGVCDFYLLMLAIWGDELEKPPLAMPNLNRYLKNLAQLPSVIKVCEVEGISLADYS